jgi:hypothetical protein
MRLTASLLLLGIVWFLVAVWDASTLSWIPRAALYFIDVPQFLYVALSATGVAVILHTWRAVLSGAAMSLGMAPHAEKEDMVKGGRAIESMGRVALWSGAVVSLTEVVISAHNAASMAGFLPALGVSALGALYGLMIRVACGLGVQVIKVRLGPFVFYTE